MSMVHSGQGAVIPSETEAASEDHVSPFFVPVIAAGMAVMATFGFLVVVMIGSILAYGFFGAEGGPPSGRILALVFSMIFTAVTLIGWGSWLHSVMTRTAAEAGSVGMSEANAPTTPPVKTGEG